MGVDYYALLDIPRNASIWEIKLAYRKLALRLHPLRKQYPQHPTPRPDDVFDLPLPKLSEDLYWELVNEAYDVLSNDLHRQVFNVYGEEGLKRGVEAPCGYVQPYSYHNDCMRTYFDVFGTNSPYADLIDASCNPPDLYKVKQGFGVVHKDPDVIKMIHLTLEDIYSGCIKTFTFERDEFEDDPNCQQKLVKEEVTLTIPIHAGCLEGTKITFPEAGDRSVTRKSADIVFITCDVPHKIFRRDKANLHMDYNVTLKQALTGFKMCIETIDFRKLEFNVTDIVDCGFEKRIKLEGLTQPGNNSIRGDLIVHFKIEFPKVIPKQYRQLLQEIFEQIEESNRNLQAERECD